MKHSTVLSGRKKKRKKREEEKKEEDCFEVRPEEFCQTDKRWGLEHKLAKHYVAWNFTTALPTHVTIVVTPQSPLCVRVRDRSVIFEQQSFGLLPLLRLSDSTDCLPTAVLAPAGP